MIGMNYQATEEKISFEEVKYWKRMFKSNLKIGVEIETCLDGSVDNDDVISALSRSLSPTNQFGNFGKHGVYCVKGDGSLSNGVELCTIGRRLDFLDLYIQYKGITNLMFAYHPDMNERAGLHNHILLDYDNQRTCLEKPVPGVILKNFFQLLRRYMPELVWITSTVNTEQFITRMDSFCSGEKLLQYTPINRDITNYCQKLTESGGSGNRYRFVNAIPMKCRGNEITQFHMELRFPDGSIYPAQIAAQNMLYYSMLVKSIELSEMGVISAGSSEYWEETKELYTSLRHSDRRNSRYDRCSNPPTQDQIEKIKIRCSDMLYELKSCLDQSDKHIFPILNILKDKPISMMRREKSDEELNADLDSIVKNMHNVNLADCTDIISAINLMKITKCNSKDHWLSSLANQMNTTVSDLQRRMFKLEQVKPTEFDMMVGAVVFK